MNKVGFLFDFIFNLFCIQAQCDQLYEPRPSKILSLQTQQISGSKFQVRIINSGNKLFTGTGEGHRRKNIIFSHFMPIEMINIQSNCCIIFNLLKILFKIDNIFVQCRNPVIYSETYISIHKIIYRISAKRKAKTLKVSKQKLVVKILEKGENIERQIYHS